MRRQPLRRSVPWSYHATVGVLRPLLMGITRRDWSGAENLPTEGGFIVAANHYSEFDPLTVGHYLVDHGYAPFFLAKASLFEVPGLGPALRHLEQVPVYRGSTHAGDALAEAERALGQGKVIGIMPEGTLTRDPDLWPMKARPGVGRLALRTRVPVIPVAQWGAQQVLGRYARRPGNILARPVQHVVAGPAVPLADLYDRADDPAAQVEATARVMRAITDQLATIRGEQPPAEPYDHRSRGGAEPASRAPVDLVEPEPTADPGGEA